VALGDFGAFNSFQGGFWGEFEGFVPIQVDLGAFWGDLGLLEWVLGWLWGILGDLNQNRVDLGAFWGV